MNHDIIAIGASVGAVEVLSSLVQHLPSNLPASIFVTLHSSPSHPSLLPELLTRRGPLPASHPLDGEKILPGRIYIAPPDNHLMLLPGEMRVVRGPKENGHRPAVDALFRTAAAAYESRVIGVVLTGHGDCGTAGLMSIKARGGITVVQTPRTASAPEMPESAMRRLDVDYVVDPAELPALFTHLAATPAPLSSEPDAAMRQLESAAPGSLSGLVCPICQGALTEANTVSFLMLRCHVGHTFSPHALLVEQSESLERALWSAVRALEESGALSKRMATAGYGDLKSRFEEKSKSQWAEADIIRGMLLRGKLMTTDDAKLVSSTSWGQQARQLPRA